MKFRKQNLAISSLLLLSGLYIVLVAMPAALGTWITGYTGTFTDDHLLVSDVFDGSPAEGIGLKAGDVVLRQADTDITEWYGWYVEDRSRYLERRMTLARLDRSIHLNVQSLKVELSLQPRLLKAAEFVRYYGIRIFLIIFLAGLSLFVVKSRTRERSALIVCLCFCSAMLWFASDQPYEPRFFSPFIHNIGVGHSAVLMVVEVVSLQLVLGTLIHLALVFPRRRMLVQRFSWLPALGYVAALLPLATVLLSGDGPLLDRTSVFFSLRLYTNSFFLLLVTGLMVDNYVRCDQPMQREQARWIVGAVGIIALAHLGLWNVPIMLTGVPLVPTYNLLLLIFLLLPVALTMSMIHHELFGIRGIIRGRIRMLEARLRRLRRLVTTRDALISGLQKEIGELQHALDQYDVAEKISSAEPGSLLVKLEHQYPEMREIRRDRLIGRSPAWEGIFEQIVLATHGTNPVLIVGESGTGKTDIAWTIHRLSGRRDQIYKQISCAQFEHSDPAFALGRLFGIGPGHGLPNVAREGQPGLLEECDGGSLLMDDFDRLPLNVQDLLLYPLEGKAFEPGVGSGPARTVSIKFIFATNRDPEELVREGGLRGDVLARMTARIEIPPLRDRIEDIPSLVELFARQISIDLGREEPVVSKRAMNLLLAYPYQQGNARELRAELYKAASKALLEDDHVLRAGYLSQKLRQYSPEGPDNSRFSQGAPDPGLANRSEQALLDGLRRCGFRIKEAETELGYSHKSRTLSNHLRGMCIQALADADWNVDQAAVKLAGDRNSPHLPSLRAKITRLLARIEDSVSKCSTDKLFNNLPSAYHEALNRTIARYAI